MAKRTNPLDTDAAKPLDLTELNAALQKVQDSHDRIMTDVRAEVQKARQAVLDGVNIANGLIELVGQIIPLVTRVTPPEGQDYVTRMTSRVAELRSLVCALTGKCL